MGRLLLVARLGLRDLRHRPAQAVLLLLAIAAGTATLTLGLALQGTTDDPYARTRAATNGPDVVATMLTDGSNAPGPATTARPGDTSGKPADGQVDTTALQQLASAAGVVANSGPFPVAWTLLRDGGTTGSAEVEGRDTTTATVDQPHLMQGAWVRPGGVVVEAGFASALDIHLGDALTLGGTTVRVLGVAVTAAIPAYPDTCAQAEGCFLTNGLAEHNPGVVWATRADATRIAGTDGPQAYFLNLTLSNPAAAAVFAGQYGADTSGSAPALLTWQQIQAANAQTLTEVQQILVLGSWLLALLAVASVAVLAGGRLVEQTRRVGLVKAAGGTPGFVAVVLLVEHVVVALAAAVLGLVFGWLTAPLVDRPSAGLLGAASAPAMRTSTVLYAIALAVGVAVAATTVPVVRATRQSTVAALNDAARHPHRREAVIRLSANLPVTLLLGIRLATRRPRRLLLSVLSIAVTISGLVIVMIFHATKTSGLIDPRVNVATTIISVMLVLLAAVNAVFVAWTTALDARHPAALARALGATPNQITTGLSAAQLFPTLAGALLGILAGVGTYYAAKTGGDVVLPSALSLLALLVATLLVIAALTALPTRIANRTPAIEALQAETT
jgi:putative ABC transport system permease protein